MDVKRVLTVFRQPNLWARLQLYRDVQTGVRLQFLYFAVESGLLQALRAPISRDELVKQLGVKHSELLGVALDLGVALKELSLRDGRYAVTGRRARALLGPDGDTLAATIQEFVAYHGSVYQELAARLGGAPPGDYLDRFGTVIARSSRVLEPFIANFVKTTAKSSTPVRLLEIGCGSGIYLRYAAQANPQLTGIALDMERRVAEQALANLREWGLADRFKVLTGDIRQPPAEVAGPFDLVTLHNNVYYFTPEERPTLFGRIRSWLAPGGALALTTLMRGTTLTALDFDLALRCTEGCTPLPEIAELTAQLRQGGFTTVEHSRLMPFEPLYSLTAR